MPSNIQAVPEPETVPAAILNPDLAYLETELTFEDIAEFGVDQEAKAPRVAVDPWSLIGKLLPELKRRLFGFVRYSRSKGVAQVLPQPGTRIPVRFEKAEVIAAKQALFAVAQVMGILDEFNVYAVRIGSADSTKYNVGLRRRTAPKSKPEFNAANAAYFKIIGLSVPK